MPQKVQMAIVLDIALNCPTPYKKAILLQPQVQPFLISNINSTNGAASSK
ncbi:predicted protein [Botrytis cinerea T4]|uniref:Uncharacterized protein n=1 Tax=Botryotinia fuckeliana (strain T4) TaxID=999810 RepID=G2Y2M5_BOTF4|nr:predicted protein [Botrytis cinerea T4]